MCGNSVALNRRPMTIYFKSRGTKVLSFLHEIIKQKNIKSAVL